MCLRNNIDLNEIDLIKYNYCIILLKNIDLIISI